VTTNTEALGDMRLEDEAWAAYYDSRWRKGEPVRMGCLGTVEHSHTAAPGQQALSFESKSSSLTSATSYSLDAQCRSMAWGMSGSMFLRLQIRK
jgi:hypothetical protein